MAQWISTTDRTKASVQNALMAYWDFERTPLEERLYEYPDFFRKDGNFYLFLTKVIYVWRDLPSNERQKCPARTGWIWFVGYGHYTAAIGRTATVEEAQKRALEEQQAFSLEKVSEEIKR
jgi:hypothetical protein